MFYALFLLMGVGNLTERPTIGSILKTIVYRILEFSYMRLDRVTLRARKENKRVSPTA